MNESRPWPGKRGPVFHLAPVPIWEGQQEQATYTPEAFEQDGFVHCTIGEENVLAVGDAFYAADHRPYVALVLDLEQVDAPVRYEDDLGIFPHIHGPLPRDAVTDVYSVIRAADGSFMELTQGS